MSHHAPGVASSHAWTLPAEPASLQATRSCENNVLRSLRRPCSRPILQGQLCAGRPGLQPHHLHRLRVRLQGQLLQGRLRLDRLLVRLADRLPRCADAACFPHRTPALCCILGPPALSSCAPSGAGRLAKPRAPALCCCCRRLAGQQLCSNLPPFSSPLWAPQTAFSPASGASPAPSTVPRRASARLTSRTSSSRWWRPVRRLPALCRGTCLWRVSQGRRVGGWGFPACVCVGGGGRCASQVQPGLALAASFGQRLACFETWRAPDVASC
jgi:hypothetical protein